MSPVTRILSLLLLLTPMMALAESYRVDLIVFLDKSGTGGEWGRHPALPDMRRALEPGDAAGLKSAGITLLPPEESALNPQWQRLLNAKRYQPLIRASWIQQSPPEENGPSLRLRWGEPLGGDAAGMTPVDGTVALTAGHYLHLESNLLYTQASGEGHISFRLRENRLMRRDELHHLDSPKLGILARVTKAGN